MLKKYIAILMMALVGAIAVNAQSSVGSWYSFPVFSGVIDQIIDGKNKVFFTSANRLYSYDKDSDELYSWSPANSLNDTNVSKIYYNPDRGYLLVTYDTSNIDVINEATNRVTNLSDIKASGLNMSKTINDVAFDDGRIYVATDFGLVVYNDKNFQVIESGIYDKAVKFVAVTEGLVFINIGYQVLASPVSVRHNSLDKFTDFNTSLGLSSMDAINGGLLMYYGYGKSLYKFMIDPEQMKLTAFTSLNLPLETNRPSLNRDGKYVVYTSSKLYVIDQDGNVAEQIALPDELKGNAIAMSKGTESVWAGNKDGVGNYAIADDGSVTTLANKIKPRGTMSFAVPILMSASADGSHIYVGRAGWSAAFQHSQSGSSSIGGVNVFVDGEPMDVTPEINYTGNKRNDKNIWSVTALCADPRNPNRYILGASFEYLNVVEDGKIVRQFDSKNSPLYGDLWGKGIPTGIQFDTKGNLWLAQHGLYKYEPLAMLPAEKFYGSEEITKSDWKVATGMVNLGLCGHLDFRICFPKKAPRYGLFSYGTEFPNNIGVIDTNNMTCYVVSPVIDQDGKTITFDQITSMCEDQKGRIWMGTMNGVFEITNPADVLNADFRVNRLKVPRNDGTNFADYLLDSDYVYCIAIDGSNRKWIGTKDSGLYLVSENGDQILANYNIYNSDIPSNTVFSVICDPNSNLVYVGTTDGVATFGSTSAPSAPNYSDIYAYPNPVKPGYTGYITVRGLMDDSLVKIADSAGNVVHQGRSNGGMFVWDGNNLAGNRVSSGVYYVFASQNEGDSSSAAVTKIVVIN